MPKRLTGTILAALGVALLLAASAGAAMIGIYRNSLDTTGQRSQAIKLSGKECARGGSEEALRITLGKATPECSYRTAVLGRDLEIGATGRLLSGTPKPAQNGAYLGLELRAGAGAKYQMLVFPLQRKVQLVKLAAGGAEYLAIDRDEKAVMGLNKANAMRLRAIDVRSGPEKGKCHVLAYLGSALVAEATDETPGDLSGQFSGFSVGAVKNSNGVVASVDDLVVRVPSPF